MGLCNVPATSFGQTAVEIVEYYHWYSPDEKRYTAHPLTWLRPFNPEELTLDCIPIGSVEFTLDWFKGMGVDNVKPLNIPKELWEYCRHFVTVDYCSNVNGRFMLKDTSIIKADCNGECYFHGDGGSDKKYFFE